MTERVHNTRRMTAAFLCAVVSSAAWGATAMAAPNVDAGTVLRDWQQSERVLPERSNPQVKVEQEIKPPLATGPAFKTTVKGYKLTGQLPIGETELLPLLAEYTGRELDVAGLQQAADQVTRYYRDKGYFVAQAYLPVQEIENGQVEITVLVGRCGEVRLNNQTGLPDALIREQLKALQPGAYIHTMLLERAALLAGDLPGVAAQATLVPGKQPGLTDLVVEVKPKGTVWQGSVGMNNWGSRLTGYNQGLLSFAWNNPWQRGDILSGSLTNTGSDLDAGNLNYRLTLGEGGVLNIGYSKVTYELGKDMAALQAHGSAYTTHFDWTYALNRSRNANLYTQIGYDRKRLEDRIDQSGDITHKRSRAISYGIQGDSYDDWWGGGSNSYSLMQYRGELSGETNSSGTSLARGNYTKTTYSLMRQQYLQDRWSLFAALSGQWSNANLDSSEKFSLGGANAVRAYPSGEASGDEAWLGTLELRYTIPLPDKSMWQLAGFYDTGTSYLEKHPTQQATPNRRSLSGMGISLGYSVANEYSVKAVYARRLGSEEAQADTTFAKERVWLQVMRYF